jgi:RNA 2',3'-cyclic 3'-phosphodiesterase
MAHARHQPATAGAQSSLFGAAAPLQVHRLFLGLFPDAPARDAINAVVAGIRPGLSPGIRTNDPSRFHLTLHFLGDSEGIRSDLEQAAIDACARVHARDFDVRLDYFSTFRGKKPIGVLRNRLTPPRLQALHDELKTPLARAGFARWLEPDFEPHVTLFYGDRELQPQAIAPIRWRATEFRLIRSVYGQSVYHTLGCWPLQGAGEAMPET